MNASAASTSTFVTDGGTIAYDVAGSDDGNRPLVICVPGMGELRSSFRHTVTGLVAAGHRVAAFDLRGHGDSSITFDRYDDEAAADDIVSLAQHLGSDAIVILGNSMGAAAGVIVAARHPGLVRGLALIGPFVRNPKTNPVVARLMSLASKGPWAKLVWKTYYRSLAPSGDRVEIGAHQKLALDAVNRPGYWAAFQRTAALSHAVSESLLGQVHTPVLVVMGTKDKDFSDPAAEAGWIAQTLDGRVLLVDGAGHYPMAEQPEIVTPALTAFLAEIPAQADDRRA